ncbi:MAG: F0F1 ATP synthase subunit epsilon, partial [Bacteroidota bacterium]
MHLTIITPDKKIFEGTVQKVTLPGSSGTFQVLKDHAAILSILNKGPLFYQDEIRDY